MAIPDEDVAKVRQATDIAALIGEHTSLKRVGRRLVGLCPFHGEKTPSFSVNAEEGLYYCFGCQASGDAISFVRAVEGCDFVEAVERLAGRAGISIRNDADPGAEASRARRQGLYQAVAAAAAYYHSFLLSDPAAGRARQYLRSRGYGGETVRQFQIGFAPPGRGRLVRELGLGVPLLREAGLVAEDRYGRPGDVFADRVIFPIFDPGGRAIALGGRILPEELSGRSGAGPKYRNSAESPIYQKRATLYGLNWAKTEISHTHEAVVCEGYTDVIGFFIAGVRRAVATCGTALTEDHFRLLSRFARRVVLCFDADSAGQNAAARLYEWERRHELELAVAELPAGSDPSELARTDPPALAAAVAAARPFLGFQLERALAAADLSTPEGRARAAEVAIAAIAEHPNELVRDDYAVRLADRTHHDPARIRELLEARRRANLAAPTGRLSPIEAVSGPDGGHDGEAGAARARARASVGRGEDSTKRSGRDALVLAIHRPAEVADLLEEVLFLDEVQLEAFRALSGASELHEAIAKAPPGAAELLARLAVSDEADEIDPAGNFVELVRAAAGAAVNELDRQARQADPSGAPADLRAINETIQWLKGNLETLRDALVLADHESPAMASARALLAWLLGRQQEE